MDSINMMHGSAFRLKILVILFLILTTYISFSQALNHKFINLDDNIYVIENPYVQGGLTRRGFIWAFSIKNDAGLWIPLTWLSLMLDSHFYGLNAGGYHLTNLLFHIINALLLFFVFEGITGAFWQSAFVAFLFALHPLRVESVAWVTERKDVLSTLFFMLTIWAYAFYAKRPGVKRYFPVLLLFTLGLMSKPMLVSVPFVLLLLDYWPLGRFQPGESSLDYKGPPYRGFCKTGAFFGFRTGYRVIGDEGPPYRGFCRNVNKKSRAPGLFCQKIPLFFLAVCFGIMTFLTQKSAGAVSSLDSFSLKFRVPNAFVSYVKYIVKMIWPRYLAVFYPHPEMFQIWQVTGAVLFLLSVSLLIIRNSPGRPYLTVGWLWYLGTLFPVIGVVQAGLQAMADRFTYIPLIGLFIIIAWGIPDILTRWRYGRGFLGISAALVLLALMICTWFQVRYWQDSCKLFEHTLDITDNNWLIHYNLGHALISRGMLKEGIAHYEEALRINPDYERAHYNLGLILINSGMLKEGIAHYKEALRINPDSERVHNNLGIVFAGQGRIKEAVFHYREALRINPDYGLARFNLGVALARQGDIMEAISHYREALRLMPGFAKAHFHLGISYLKTGDLRGAIEEYKILNIMNNGLAEILFDKVYDVGLHD